MSREQHLVPLPTRCHFSGFLLATFSSLLQLYGPGKVGEGGLQSVRPGSTVTIVFDPPAGTLSFSIDDRELGVLFKGIKEGTALHPCAAFYSSDREVTLLRAHEQTEAQARAAAAAAAKALAASRASAGGRDAAAPVSEISSPGGFVFGSGSGSATGSGANSWDEWSSVSGYGGARPPAGTTSGLGAGAGDAGAAATADPPPTSLFVDHMSSASQLPRFFDKERSAAPVADLDYSSTDTTVSSKRPSALTAIGRMAFGPTQRAYWAFRIDSDGGRIAGTNSGASGAHTVVTNPAIAVGAAFVNPQNGFKPFEGDEALLLLRSTTGRAQGHGAVGDDFLPTPLYAAGDVISVVYDGPGGSISMYRNGEPLGRTHRRLLDYAPSAGTGAAAAAAAGSAPAPGGGLFGRSIAVAAASAAATRRDASPAAAGAGAAAAASEPTPAGTIAAATEASLRWQVAPCVSLMAGNRSVSLLACHEIEVAPRLKHGRLPAAFEQWLYPGAAAAPRLLREISSAAAQVELWEETGTARSRTSAKRCVAWEALSGGGASSRV
jgi:hypothetical protein